MSAITFIVSDVNCEAAPPNLVPPNAIIVPVSTTTVATVRGYPEWSGFESRPPKKFHRAAWSGTSEHQLFIGSAQIGGSKYEYSGTDIVDSGGNIVSTHTKNYSVECDGDPHPGIYVNIQGNALDGQSLGYNFRGYYGISGGDFPEFCGHPTVLCPSPSIPYVLIGDTAVNGENDNSDLWGSQKIIGSVNLGVAKFTHESNTIADSIETATDSVLITRYLPEFGKAYAGHPADFWTPGTINYIHNFQCELLVEYTDSEALANAVVTNGNSAIAKNLPRTTGFVSTFVTVAFSIVCTNLVAGNAYVVQVEFFDATSGARITKQYGISATGSTAIVHDSVPTPIPGRTLEVRKPHIALVPPSH